MKYIRTRDLGNGMEITEAASTITGQPVDWETELRVEMALIVVLLVGAIGAVLVMWLW